MVRNGKRGNTAAVERLRGCRGQEKGRAVSARGPGTSVSGDIGNEWSQDSRVLKEAEGHR